jgi:hypothetical protein
MGNRLLFSGSRSPPAVAPPRATAAGLLHRVVERVAGIEPAYSAWKAAALPLCYTRMPSSLRRGAPPGQYGFVARAGRMKERGGERPRAARSPTLQSHRCRSDRLAPLLERFLLSLFGVTTASSRVRQTRRKKKGPANEWPALESFRRGCLKGTPFVQCSTVSRKCVEGHCDCKNCNCDWKAAFLGYEGVDKAPDPSRIAKDEISCFTG